MNNQTSIALFGVLLSLSASAASAQMTYSGVNLSGAEFGEKHLPGTFNTDYTYPTNAEVDYFMGKGMNTIRLPFLWERLQPALSRPLDAEELKRMTTFVDYATGKGGFVIIDPHNFARREGKIIGADATVSNAAFADFWSRIAEAFKSNDHTMFGLVNEPHDMPSTDSWVVTANEAIAAIRKTGAKNLILVPGNAWTGAWTWTSKSYGVPNSVAMLKIKDPGNNYAFDVHQYLDTDGSGTHDTIVNATIGSQRLTAFTNWLKSNRKRGFLGEFAVPNGLIGDGPNQNGDEALKDMLRHLEANRDVWLGWAWWGAGPWWPKDPPYMFALDPDGQKDRAAMTILEKHPAKGPTTTAPTIRRN